MIDWPSQDDLFVEISPKERQTTRHLHIRRRRRRERDDSNRCPCIEMFVMVVPFDSWEPLCGVSRTISFETHRISSLVADVPHPDRSMRILRCSMMLRTVVFIPEQCSSNLKHQARGNSSLLVSLFCGEFAHVPWSQENTWWLHPLLPRNTDIAVFCSLFKNTVVISTIRSKNKCQSSKKTVTNIGRWAAQLELENKCDIDTRESVGEGEQAGAPCAEWRIPSQFEFEIRRKTFSLVVALHFQGCHRPVFSGCLGFTETESAVFALVIGLLICLVDRASRWLFELEKGSYSIGKSIFMEIGHNQHIGVCWSIDE